LYAAEGKKYDRLEALAQSFKHVNREFLFLVNQSDRQGSSMTEHIKRVRLTLLQIMTESEDAIESKDRISLITFAKNLRRIYTLVEKRQNFVQLRNQIKHLQADKKQQANLAKAL
jgi:hypothetical protein